MPNPDPKTIFITIFATGPIASGKSRAIHAMLEGLRHEFVIRHNRVQEELGIQQHQIAVHLKEDHDAQS